MSEIKQPDDLDGDNIRRVEIPSGTYVGEVDENLKPKGKGTLIYRAPYVGKNFTGIFDSVGPVLGKGFVTGIGWVFDGELKEKGRLEGILTYINGSQFIGTLESRLPVGDGLFIDEDGRELEGNWVKGSYVSELTIKDTIYSVDEYGDITEKKVEEEDDDDEVTDKNENRRSDPFEAIDPGNVIKGYKLEDYGQFFYQNGGKFAGNVKDGLPHRKGKYIKTSGEEIDGDWTAEGNESCCMVNDILYIVDRNGKLTETPILKPNAGAEVLADIDRCDREDLELRDTGIAPPPMREMQNLGQTDVGEHDHSDEEPLSLAPAPRPIGGRSLAEVLADIARRGREDLELRDTDTAPPQMREMQNLGQTDVSEHDHSGHVVANPITNEMVAPDSTEMPTREYADNQGSYNKGHRRALALGMAAIGAAALGGTVVWNNGGGQGNPVEPEHIAVTAESMRGLSSELVIALNEPVPDVNKIRALVAEAGRATTEANTPEEEQLGKSLQAIVDGPMAKKILK